MAVGINKTALQDLVNGPNKKRRKKDCGQTENDAGKGGRHPGTEWLGRAKGGKAELGAERRGDQVR